ncbi:MAG: hypothetical protein WDO73_29160 [Ignavibacteriota bacterium]
MSIASLLMVVASVFFFLACAWGIMSQQLDEGGGVMAMAGWLVAAIVFSYRFADPKWLDPDFHREIAVTNFYLPAVAPWALSNAGSFGRAFLFTDGSPAVSARRYLVVRQGMQGSKRGSVKVASRWRERCSSYLRLR